MNDFIGSRSLKHSTLMSAYDGPNLVSDAPIYNRSEANLVTSVSSDGDYHSQEDVVNAPHLPVLDLDYPCTLLPSSSEGKYHLYIHKPVPWDKYVKVLEAMSDAELLEPGYVRASIARGYTAVRAPWVKKHVDEHTIAASDTVSDIPFSTYLRLTEDEFGNRDLHLSSVDPSYKWTRSIAHTEFITEPEEYPLRHNEVWVRRGTGGYNGGKYTVQAPDNKVVDKLVERGFLVDRGVTIRVTSPHFEGAVLYNKYFVETRRMSRDGSEKARTFPDDLF